MRMHRWISGFLAAVLVATMAGSALASGKDSVPCAVYGCKQTEAEIQVVLDAAGITDVKAGDWYGGSVAVLVQAGLLPPVGEGKFQPEATLNAGDGIAVFAKVLGIAPKTDTPEQALQKAKDAGIVGADATADRDMTRVEVARLLAIALGVQPPLIVTRATYPFNDYDAVSEADRAILAALYNLGIFKGYEDRTFRPDKVLTRAEIAVLVDRILGVK